MTVPIPADNDKRVREMREEQSKLALLGRFFMGLWASKDEQKEEQW
jgi:hypothetical protein